jgi:hypothetical protein
MESEEEDDEEFSVNEVDSDEDEEDEEGHEFNDEIFKEDPKKEEPEEYDDLQLSVSHPKRNMVV